MADFASRLLAKDLTVAAPIERMHQVAGRRISVRFSDSVLAEIYSKRLNASQGVEGDPDHRLIIVHAADIGWTSSPAWIDRRCSPRLFQDAVACQHLKIAYPGLPHLWQIYSPATRIGVQLTTSRSDLPLWDFGAPLRVHLHWLLATHGLRLTHAATLGRRGRGVLIVGNGGAGKSGTCLGGLAAGMVTCGDDYVALDLHGSPKAHLIFRIIKQDLAGLSRIAALHGKFDGTAPNWQAKIELDPETLFPGCLTDCLTIDAVLLASIAGGVTANIVPVSRGEIMRAIMRSNLYQFPGEDDDGLGFFSKLLGHLPCFRIELSSDPVANSDAIDGLLEKVRP